MPLLLHTPAVIGRRACALLAFTSAALHLLVAMSGGHLAMVVLALCMAFACAICARHLWRGPDLPAWFAIAMMNLAMLATHLSLGGCHTKSPTPTSAGTPSDLIVAATGLAAAEVVIAVGVIFLRTRNPMLLLPSR
ncbi:hypothetical protein ACWDTI_03060 [Gordonia sp. NPDC003424]